MEVCWRRRGFEPSPRLFQTQSMLRAVWLSAQKMPHMAQGVRWPHGGQKRINSVGVISKAWLPILAHTRGSFYSLFAIESRLNSSAWNSKQSTIWLPPRPPTAPPPPAAWPQQPYIILGTQETGFIAVLAYFHPH